MSVTATIQELLQGIMDSQYGRDMRQFIHDAIQKCYEEGSAGETDIVARDEIDEIRNDMVSSELSPSIINYFNITMSGVYAYANKCYYYKRGTSVIIHLKVQIQSGTTYIAFATMPEGYRPRETTGFVVPFGESNFAYFGVQSNGYLRIRGVPVGGGTVTADAEFDVSYDVFEEAT